MAVYYATHRDFERHFLPDRQHPERPERIQSVWHQMRKLDNALMNITPIPATTKSLQAIHTDEHLDTLSWIASQDKVAMYDSDTYALPESYAIARLASGAVISAVDVIMTGEGHSALVAVRPPGHHATSQQAMGFCLLNNIAIGAQHAIDSGYANRVAIVDFDVHHGNGTQDIFYGRNDVLFVSTHQSPFYPGTGALNEVGIGAGVGTTMNIPLPAGVGDIGYEQVFDEAVVPWLKQHKPELIMVSAGFDGHWRDPLAMMRLSLKGYANITQKLISLAKETCAGRIIFVMEGGYDALAIGCGMVNIATLLLGRDDLEDPYGEDSQTETPVKGVIEAVKQKHQL